MICNICNTNNLDPAVEFCVQCGSDLKVFKILNQLGEMAKPAATSMEAAVEKPLANERKTLAKIIGLLQIMTLLLFFSFAVVGIIAGVKLINYLDNKEATSNQLANKWSDTGLQQLQQMQSIVRDELDMIIETRRTNELLQSKLQRLQLSIKNTTESGMVSEHEK